MQIYTDNREWKVLGSPTAEKFAVKYPCCPEKYEYIDFKFELQRDSPAYRSVIILPCLGNSDLFEYYKVPTLLSLIIVAYIM